MESVNKNINNSDKEEGELSNDDDGGNQEECVPKNSHSAKLGRETKRMRRFFPVDQNRICSTRRIESSPKKGYGRQRKKTKIHHSFRQNQQTSSKYSAMSEEQFRISTVKFSPSSRSKIPSSAQKDIQDELKKLEAEQKKIQQQLKNLEEEEQNTGQNENENHLSVCDSLLDAIEILQGQGTRSEVDKQPIPFPFTPKTNNNVINNSTLEAKNGKDIHQPPPATSERHDRLLETVPQKSHSFQEWHQQLQKMICLANDNPKLVLQNLLKFSKEWDGTGRELVTDVIEDIKRQFGISEMEWDVTHILPEKSEDLYNIVETSRNLNENYIKCDHVLSKFDEINVDINRDAEDEEKDNPALEEHHQLDASVNQAVLPAFSAISDYQDLPQQSLIRLSTSELSVPFHLNQKLDKQQTVLPVTFPQSPFSQQPTSLLQKPSYSREQVNKDESRNLADCQKTKSVHINPRFYQRGDSALLESENGVMPDASSNGSEKEGKEFNSGKILDDVITKQLHQIRNNEDEHCSENQNGKLNKSKKVRGVTRSSRFASFDTNVSALPHERPLIKYSSYFDNQTHSVQSVDAKSEFLITTSDSSDQAHSFGYNRRVLLPNPPVFNQNRKVVLQNPSVFDQNRRIFLQNPPKNIAESYSVQQNNSIEHSSVRMSARLQSLSRKQHIGYPNPKSSSMLSQFNKTNSPSDGASIPEPPIKKRRFLTSSSESPTSKTSIKNIPDTSDIENFYLESCEPEEEEDTDIQRQKLLDSLHAKRKTALKVPSNEVTQASVHLDSSETSDMMDVGVEPSAEHRDKVQTCSEIVNISQEGEKNVLSFPVSNEDSSNVKDPQSLAVLCKMKLTCTESHDSESQRQDGQLVQHPVQYLVLDELKADQSCQNEGEDPTKLDFDNTRVDVMKTQTISQVEMSQLTITEDTVCSNKVVDKLTKDANCCTIATSPCIETQTDLCMSETLSMDPDSNNCLHISSIKSSICTSKENNLGIDLNECQSAQTKAVGLDSSYSGIASSSPNDMPSQVKMIQVLESLTPNLPDLKSPLVSLKCLSSKTAHKIPSKSSADVFQRLGPPIRSQSCTPSFSRELGSNINPQELPVHPKVIVLLSPSSGSEDDCDDYREILADSEEPLPREGDQDSNVTFGNDRIWPQKCEVRGNKRASSQLVRKVKKQTSLVQSIQAVEKAVSMHIERAQNFLKARLREEKKLDKLYAQLSTLHCNISTSKKLIKSYRTVEKKAKRQIQKYEKHLQTEKVLQVKKTKTDTLRKISLKPTDTIQNVKSFDVELSRESTTQENSLTRAQEIAQEKQRLLERINEIANTIKTINEDIAEKETRIAFTSKVVKGRSPYVFRSDKGACSDTSVQGKQKSLLEVSSDINLDLSSFQWRSNETTNLGKENINVAETSESDLLQKPDGNGIDVPFSPAIKLPTESFQIAKQSAESQRIPCSSNDKLKDLQDDSGPPSKSSPVYFSPLFMFRSRKKLSYFGDMNSHVHKPKEEADLNLDVDKHMSSPKVEAVSQPLTTSTDPQMCRPQPMEADLNLDPDDNLSDPGVEFANQPQTVDLETQICKHQPTEEADLNLDSDENMNHPGVNIANLKNNARHFIF